MAASLASLDHWVSDRRDIQKRNIAHAIKGRLTRKGFAWLSVRLLLRDICACSWSEGAELIQELIEAGEFYRVTARGAGCGKGRTLYFYGWAHRQLLEQELNDNRMPLAAFHQVERCLAEFRARLSFFRRSNVAGEQRHSSPQEGSTTRKDARDARDRPARASHGPPRQKFTPPVNLRPTPGDPEAGDHDVTAVDVEVPEDLRYLYPHRFPEAPRPKRLKGRNGQLEPLSAYVSSAVLSRKPPDDP